MKEKEKMKEKNNNMRGKFSFIIPQLFETNGRVEKFMSIARDKKVQNEYNKLCSELNTHPKDFGKKLRKTTWNQKSLNEVLEELDDR